MRLDYKHRFRTLLKLAAVSVNLVKFLYSAVKVVL